MDFDGFHPRDSHVYEAYSLENYQNGRGPPLVEKTSKVIAAVVQNRPDLLRELLDEIQWYYVEDADNNTLLHIAILCSNVEVFDCMLSIPDFPLELLNELDFSPIELALSHPGSEHFAYELVLKGVDLLACPGGRSTYVEDSILQSYYRVAILLVERGADVNYTLLELAMQTDQFDLVTAMLTSPAILTASIFENCDLWERPEQETLFFLLLDQHSKVKLELCVLIKLAEKRSSLLNQLAKCNVAIRFTDGFGLFYFCQLCSLDTECLRLLIDNFAPCLKEILYPIDFSNIQIIECQTPMRLDSFIILLESDLHRPATFGRSRMRFPYFQYLANVLEINVEELYLCFLSYGFHVTVSEVEFVYKTYGYNEFFKTLLYMDIKLPLLRHFKTDVIFCFICDITMDLNAFFRNPRRYIHQELLSRYFRHPFLTELLAAHRSESTEEEDERRELQLVPRLFKLAWYRTEDERREPQLVPRLLELARNSFRASVAHRFDNCGQFYTFLRHLEIPEVCKKIISFERPMYL